MKKFQEQFEGYRKLIKDNLGTIKGLMKQSEDLNSIIEELGKIEGNAEIKKSLEEMKEQMSKSIELLFDSTEKLFDKYIQLLKDLEIIK